MSRQALKKGDRLSLYSENSGEPLVFEILSEPLGEGGSCIVYDAAACGSPLVCKYRLKELYPESIGGIFRNENNDLCISEDCRKEYSKACEKFNKSLELLWEMAYSDDTGCYTVCPLGKFIGGGGSVPAQYLITQWMPSDSISTANLCGSDLHLIAGICLKTALAVSEFHKKGYINFDIKPENILYSPKTDTVAFFDTDTVFRRDSAEKITPSFSEGAAPEIVNGFVKLYSEHCDIFSIGSMLHRFITGENYYPGQYSLCFGNCLRNAEGIKMLENANPRSASLVYRIFAACNAGNPSKRCSDDELIEMLSELSEASMPSSIYAESSCIRPSSDSFVCSDELYSVRKLLSAEGYLVIQGLKGSGKTELAKCYAAEAGQYYHTIVWADYAGSIKETVSRIGFFGINDDEYDSTDKLFEMKYEQLKKYDSGMLLIIDGIDERDDHAEEFFKSLSIHILATSSYSGSFDSRHIYTMTKEQNRMFNSDEIAGFHDKMTELQKICRTLRIFYTVLFCLAFAMMIGFAAMYEFISVKFGIPMIVSVLLTLLFKSMIFKRADKESLFAVCRKNCFSNFKAANAFANNTNNHQIFELSTPEFIPPTEKKRHRFRVVFGTASILGGIVTTFISFAVNSFPFLLTSYSLILLAVFIADFRYYMKLTNEEYRRNFGRTDSNGGDLLEIYRFRSRTDSKNISDKLSCGCARHIMYNEYKSRCDVWGTFDVLTKIIVGIIVVASVLDSFSMLPGEYFHLPGSFPDNIPIFAAMAIFGLISAVTVASSGGFYKSIKQLLFTINSDDSTHVSEKFAEYTEESLISETSFARGIYNFAVIQFENGIPIYEIRKPERPTFRQYCITQRARTAVYFLLITLAEIGLIWHFYAYAALLPALLLDMFFCIWWYFSGMYAFNRRALGLEEI